jgi:PPIC-type PPIASE domain
MSRKLVYGRAKYLSLACVILWADSTTAKTPLQTAPGTVGASQPSTTIQAGTTPSSPGSTPPKAAQPNGVQPNTAQPPVINRYVPRPAMVPFNPEQPSYKPLDLPPPTAAFPLGPRDAADIHRSAQSLIGAANVPLKSSAPFAPPANRIDSSGLPGASQLLPRNSQAFNPTQSTNQGGFQPGQISLTPISADATVPLIPGAVVPDLTRGANSGSMVLAGFGNLSEADERPQFVNDLMATRLIAVVGTDRILAGDMAAMVEPVIMENKAKIRSKQEEENLRTQLTRQALPTYVQKKALQQEFFRDIAGNVPPKELQKKQDEVMAMASKAFYTNFVQVELFKKHDVDNVADLEQKLQENRLSLPIMKNFFLMQVFSMQLEDKYIAHTFEISPAEILAYYRANSAKWEMPARAKWRQLTVRFDRHSNRAEADNMIRQMGNEIATGGRPFEAVAKAKSEGFTAEDGGKHDWTTQGSVKSAKIDQAIFTLPLARLSEIIEDEVGLHIIEVMEREAARTQDMSEIQTEIREILSNKIRDDKLKEFHKKVLDRVPIWSQWPEDIPGARPLDQAVADQDETLQLHP